MDNPTSQQKQPQQAPRKRPRPSASRSSAPLAPTWYGIVMTTTDALRLFEAVLLGQLLHTARRPHDREREGLIQSGNVFIFEESSSGIKRWTDGHNWSPSRILGNFLVYRELHKDLPPGEKKRAIKRKRDSDPELQNGQAGPVDEGRRALLGSLIESYIFKEGGLMKKTISIEFNDTSHHLVSYYSYEDASNGRLPTPSQDPRLCNLRPRLGLMTNQEFRIEMDQENPRLLEEATLGLESAPYDYPPQSIPQMPNNMLQPYGTPGQFHISMPMDQSIGPNAHMNGHFAHNTNSSVAWDHRNSQPMHHPYQSQALVDQRSKRRRSEPWEIPDNTSGFFSPGSLAHGPDMATTGHHYYPPSTTSYPAHMPPTTLGSESMNFPPALTSMAPPPQISPVSELPLTTMDFPPSMPAMAPMTTMEYAPSLPAMAPMTTRDFAPSAPAMAPMAPGHSNVDGSSTSNSLTSMPSHSGSPLDGPTGMPHYFSSFNTTGWNHAHHDNGYMSGSGNSFNVWPNASSSSEHQH